MEFGYCMDYIRYRGYSEESKSDLGQGRRSPAWKSPNVHW